MGLKAIKLIVNGKNVSLDLENFSYKDEKGVLSDSITLQVAGEFERPKYKDEIKAYIDDFYCGIFSVQNVKFSKHTTTIEATAINFSGDLKEKKFKDFKDTSIDKICKEIASNHSLDCKANLDTNISHISQINQSDLEFLKKLSQDYNATFSVKNNTLLFLKDSKSDIQTTYKIDENECENWELEYTNKTLFNSCKAVWHDTKENKTKSITVGSGNPIKTLEAKFKDEDEAKQKAKSALEVANKGTIKGNLSIYGQIIEAGAKLNFKNQIFQIISVNHSINTSGWNIEVEFEN